MPIQSETELYAPIKAYFQQRGYEVKSEINQCDLVAIHKDMPEPVIVELKKNFNLSLLLQGMNRLKLSSHVFLAVEYIRGRQNARRHKWSDLQQLCERLGFGFITVQFYKTKQPFVEVHCEPIGVELSQPQRKRKTKRLLNEFHERSGDYNIGGSTRRKIMTSYRELALQCAAHIKQLGPLSPAKLRDLTGKQKVGSILQKNYYQWFKRIKRGVYDLTTDGHDALATYEEVLDFEEILDE